MQRTQLSTTAMLVLMSLAACGPKGGSATAPNPGNGFKQDLRAEAMKAKPLSAAQKSELSQIYKKGQGNNPSESLYFDDYKNPQDKQHDLGELTDLGRSYVTKVKGNCQIVPGTDQVTGQSAVGQTQTTTHEKSISGPKCPIQLSSKESTALTITSLDQATGVVSGTMHMESSENMSVLDNDMKTNMLLVKEDSSVSGDSIIQAAKYDMTSKLIAGSIYGNTSMKMTGQMPGNISVTVTMRGESMQTPTQQNAQMLMEMSLSDGLDVVIAMFKNGDKSEYLLNGEPYTADRLKQDFGINLGM